MPIRNTWRPGDHLVECDRTGFTVYASQSKKEWTGHIVRDQSWEPRHPQDFVRGIGDKQSVYDPRPQNLTRRVGPLYTTIHEDYSGGDTALSVASITGITNGDTVHIITDSGLHVTTLSAVGGGTATGGFHLTIANSLPDNALQGYGVIDITATNVATEGF